jgi:hypothetical protein
MTRKLRIMGILLLGGFGAMIQYDGLGLLHHRVGVFRSVTGTVVGGA